MTGDPSNISDQLESELGIVVSRDTVEIPNDRAASECLSQVADFLFEKGYLEMSSLPIKSGHKRYLVNMEPEHQNGNEMLRPKELPQGVYVETNYNKEETERKIRDLIRIASN